MMKDVIKRLMYYGHGVKIGPHRVPGAAFADDSWLAANSWDKVEATYYAMEEGLAQFGLEANPKSHTAGASRDGKHRRNLGTSETYIQ